jgi:hypothetical protein
LVIEMADHGHLILKGDLANGVVLGGQQLFFPEVARTAGLLGWSSVVGQLVGIDASQ